MRRGVLPREQRNMNRSKSKWSATSPALTPSTRKGDTDLSCQRCRDKEAYIVRLQDQIERLQKVVRDQSDELQKKQSFIEKVKRYVAEESAVLKPTPTKRPARKGEGL